MLIIELFIWETAETGGKIVSIFFLFSLLCHFYLVFVSSTQSTLQVSSFNFIKVFFWIYVIFIFFIEFYFFLFGLVRNELSTSRKNDEWEENERKNEASEWDDRMKKKEKKNSLWECESCKWQSTMKWQQCMAPVKNHWKSNEKWWRENDACATLNDS